MPLHKRQPSLCLGIFPPYLATTRAFCLGGERGETPKLSERIGLRIMSLTHLPERVLRTLDLSVSRA